VKTSKFSAVNENQCERVQQYCYHQKMAQVDAAPEEENSTKPERSDRRSVWLVLRAVGRLRVTSMDDRAL